MSSNGSCGKVDSGAGVWIRNTNEGHSYKLNFQCTNNIAEYEALLLGFQIMKTIGAKRISVQGDFELIIRKINGKYSTKNPRLREYINFSLDLLKKFEKYELTSVPRTQNSLANELAFVASTCQLPHANEQYMVKVKKKPIVPDNID